MDTALSSASNPFLKWKAIIAYKLYHIFIEFWYLVRFWPGFLGRLDLQDYEVEKEVLSSVKIRLGRWRSKGPRL